MEELKESGIDDSNIIYIDLDRRDYKGKKQPSSWKELLRKRERQEG